MPEALKPTKGGFLRPFGTGWFIREYLKGNGPKGSPIIVPNLGAPQVDIFHWYKLSLLQAIATDRAVRDEEKLARKEARPINPERIVILIPKYLKRLPFKSTGCRYHSFVSYFNILQQLNWVEASGVTESSSIQDHHPSAPSRIFYKLSEAGLAASDQQWANPRAVLYGRK